MKKNLLYICEVQYPSSSAYAIHVAKMCEAFVKNKFTVSLITPNSTSTRKRLKKIYNLNESINIKSIFKSKVNLNFITKIIYSIKIIFLLNNSKNKNFVISRAVIPSIILSLFRYKSVLEIHHDISGLTRLLFIICNHLKLLKNISYIFLNKSLIKNFIINNNNKYICLDDAISLKDFKIKKKHKIEKKTCVYIGSFYPGKGFDIIMKLADKCKSIKFHLYGDKTFINNKNFKRKNVKFLGYIPYFKIPYILSKYKIALMPYEKKIFGRGQIDISKSISPLKMFDYMASKKIIIASDLKIYRHILKNKYNSILIKPDSIIQWKENIEKIFKNPKKYKNISINAYSDVKKYTWDERVKKIKKKFLFN